MRSKTIWQLSLAIPILVYFCGSECTAAEVIFLHASSKPTPSGQIVELAANFYGLRLQRVEIGPATPPGFLASLLKDKELRAVVMHESLLPTVNQEEIIASLRRPDNIVPLLITSVTSDSNTESLRRWSANSVIACASMSGEPVRGVYAFANLTNLTRHLSGHEIPISGRVIPYLTIDSSPNLEVILDFKPNPGDRRLPLFIKTKQATQEIFILTDNESRDLSGLGGRGRDKLLTSLLPTMMFLRYSAGNLCWHSPGYYSNLTIDDPWLTESYGFLNYESLLREMRVHNFHTTIAFVPWNYDRSDPDVTRLVRENPERFSISIHGNNHTHQEFYKYDGHLGDLQSSVQLLKHEANIKQALARMELFTKITQLPHDRVMVFPHAIAPANTLQLLKQHGFLATVNAGNVPLDEKEPSDPIFHLRPMTLEYASFPSIDRIPVNGSSSWRVAVELFLDNPLIFYGHHDVFKEGVQSFNKTADLVNATEPRVVWRSLGHIVRHLYLERDRQDGNYDILTFSSSIDLTNTHDHEATFYVQKQENFSPPIKELTVDGQQYPFERSTDRISIGLTIRSRETRRISIKYSDELDLSSVSVAKTDFYPNLVRWLSDFRDLTLPRYTLGIYLSDVYYRSGLYRLGLTKIASILLLLAVSILAFVLMRRRNHSKAQGKGTLAPDAD